MHAAEVRLLYENATTGVVASVLIALPLAYVQRSVSSTLVISTWLSFVLVVALARFAIARRYWRDSRRESSSRRWKALFVAGTAAAAAAWGVAGMMFYDPAQPTSGIFLMFVLGGVMLGGASLLAARPEAFLTLFLPIGLMTSVRLASAGGEEHLMMAFLVVIFTAATIATTWRFHVAIASSLELRFDNLELVESLRAAKNYTDALNRDLELRVRDRTVMLTEADQRKNEFLATLAHELRNPLAPIRFALETLKGDSPPVTAARARDVIDRQVGQLVRLVDDLLDVSRITTGKMMLRREPHDLARLMTTAVESIMPLVTAADHTLEVELPVTPSYVDGDGARVVQVFANALNNAVKFTPRGGRIWFTAERQSDEAVVRIRDTGLGIAPDVLPRVFDMFQQAEPILERSAGGLGIGLTLARRLVEMHRGADRDQKPRPWPGNRGRDSTADDRGGRRTGDEGRETGGCGGAQPPRADRGRQSRCRGDARHGGVDPGPRHQSGERWCHRAHPGRAICAGSHPPGRRPARDERLRRRASLTGAARAASYPHRGRNRLGPGRGPS